MLKLSEKVVNICISLFSICDNMLGQGANRLLFNELILNFEKKSQNTTVCLALLSIENVVKKRILNHKEFSIQFSCFKTFHKNKIG